MKFAKSYNIYELKFNKYQYINLHCKVDISNLILKTISQTNDTRPIVQK